MTRLRAFGTAVHERASSKPITTSDATAVVATSTGPNTKRRTLSRS